MGERSDCSQIGVNPKRWSKNLAITEPHNKNGLAGATEQAAAIRGDILGYVWHLQKRGLKEITLRHYHEKLYQLVRLGVDLRQPERVKEFLALNKAWSETTKAIVVAICDGFLKWLKIPWEPPRYRPAKRLPFIATEEELDQLIARAGRRLAPLLQFLKETGVRRGEALQLKWTEVDIQRKTVTITPEKGSNPRILRLSDRAIAMLQTLPKTSERVFPMTVSSLSSNFYVQRKSLARKLGNPRILKIGLHTFRHWKATMEYHKTKDLIHVQQLLGHTDIKSTMVYIAIDQALFDTSSDVHVKVAESVEEACKLAEVGFEHWDTMDGRHIYRKRK